jgi:hypothetical protein
VGTVTSAIRSRLRLVIGLAVAAALVALAMVWPYAPYKCGGFLSDLIVTSTDECVGVISNSRFLDGSLKDLFDKFEADNEAVAKSGSPYVKVVLLTPLTVPPAGTPAAIPLAQVRSSLEGAFTGLKAASVIGSEFGDPPATKLQVLLANAGSRQEYAADLVAGIVAQSEPEHPVVAVVGMGSSLPGTFQTATELGTRDIPMVSAITSADSFDLGHIRGYRSVSPSNTDYANALRDFLRHQTRLRAGIIVADANEDPYTNSLRNAFATTLGGYARPEIQSFNGSTIASGAVAGVFNPVTRNICGAATAPPPDVPVDMVMYAGRVADFEAFARSLDNRRCRDRPLTILAGATGFDSVRKYENLLHHANLTVIYATSADPEAWKSGLTGAPKGFPVFLDRFRANGFDEGSLGDGYAIMYHDAVVSAAAAIRLAAEGGVPTPEGVSTQLSNIGLDSFVQGASGDLSFPDSALGRAVGKVIPLRQIGGDAAVLPVDRCVYVTGRTCPP